MKPTLHVVPPSEPSPAEKVRQRIKKMPKPPCIMSCHCCGGREIMQVKIGMEFRDNRPRGGTVQYLCANCHRKGERVVLA